MPERVATSLQQLWTATLDGAHEVLHTTLTEREAALAKIAQQQAAEAQALATQAESIKARAAAVVESVELMRRHLATALERTQTVEADLRERDALLGQARSHAEVLESASAQLRAQLTAVESAHREERDQHASAEAHWQRETDRARQAHKDSEREGKALATRVKELLMIECGALAAPQRRFLKLLEKLLEPVVRQGEAQRALADQFNGLLAAGGYRAVVSGEQSRHPLYTIERIPSGVSGGAN